MPRYTVAIEDAQAHLFRVTLTLARPAAQQRLQLPVWIPGSYLVREFARHLSGLSARQGGRKVPLRQIDKTTWQATCSGHVALEVSYLVYAFDPSVRAAWLGPQRGFFNGTSLFLRCLGREAEEHRVRLVRLPRGWQVATAMARLRGAAGHEFRAADYDELIDHPFELGPFWRGEFKVRGVPHELVVSGAGPDADLERLRADTQRICEAEIAFWHGPQGRPPFERYVFLLNTVEDGYGGLEHRASTALIAARRDLPRRQQAALGDGAVTLLGLISHEYFHSWNVKRLLPADFVPIDLARENTTELLWFFEGFTSYYDDLLLRRAGLVDAPRYLKLLAKAVNQVLATPGRRVQSVAEASFDAWTKFYRPDENTANLTVNYYTLGALIALALDLTLRRGGRASLDDVMRALWQRWAAGRAAGGEAGYHVAPLTEADILAAVHQCGGRAAADALAGWVHGTDDAPWRDLLAAFGVQWRHEAATPLQRLGARLADTLKVQAVMRGSLAERAGLCVHDELLAADGWRLRRSDDAALQPLGERSLRLLVARDQRLLELDVPPGRVEGAVQLALDERATAAVRRRRHAWLGA